MSGAKIIEGLKQAIAGGLARVTIDGQVWERKQPNIEAAHFRDLLDLLFHALPITPNMPVGVASIMRSLSDLTYKHGKQGIVEARAFLAKLEADCN